MRPSGFPRLNARTGWPELASAVEEAQVLLWEVVVVDVDNADAKQLYGRLESARTEIECLPGAHELDQEALDPEWMKLFRSQPRLAAPSG